MSASLSLTQLVDLALGTPEVGAVNFNVLHTLLHAMIHKLDLTDVKADIDEADKDFLSTKKDRDVDNKEIEKGETEALAKVPKDKTSVPYKRSHYHNLEAKVNQLEKQLETLNNLPSNSELFDRATGDKPRPVADMWQYMQLSRKVDANEEGVGKLMSLVEDLMAEMQRLKEANEKLQNQLNNLNLDDILKKLAELESLMNDLSSRFELLPNPDDIVTWPGLEDAINGLRRDLENQKPVVVDMAVQAKETPPNSRPVSAKSSRPGTRPSSAVSGRSCRPTSAKSRASSTRPKSKPNSRPPSAKSVASVESFDDKEMVSRPVSARPLSRLSTASSGPSESLAEILEKLGTLNNRHELLEERVEKLEDEMKNKADKDALSGLSVPDDLLAQLAGLQEELETLKKLREKDSQAISRAQRAILDLQAEVEKLNGTTQHLLDENGNRKREIENVTQETNRLEEVKADKEYVAMEVDVKADKRLVDGKVNRNVFDSTCQELNKMINDLLEKLAAYEEAWKKAHGQLSDDVDCKLDRMELDALKEYIDSKLKALNKKMKHTHEGWAQPTGINPEDDAAGIRKQLVHRFHCISCDRPVDMGPNYPMPSLPTQSGLPATRSPRPYTTYELDQIRQHARSLTSGKSNYTYTRLNRGKNLSNFERALSLRQQALLRKHDLRTYWMRYGRYMGKQILPPIIGGPEYADYYATTRSCGGNHTMTYPSRRTTKIIKEVMQEEDMIQVLPSKEERDLQGVDGHIYKGRVDSPVRLDARLPTQLGTGNQGFAPAPQRSPHVPHQRLRQPPSSAASRSHELRSSNGEPNRPASARPTGSRPTSARPPSRPMSASPKQTPQRPDGEPTTRDPTPPPTIAEPTPEPQEPAPAEEAPQEEQPRPETPAKEENQES